MNSFRKELIKRALWSAELKEISFLDSFPESKVPHSAEYFDMGELAALIAPRKLLISVGEIDHIFPIEGSKEVYSVIEKIYEKENAKENCKFVIFPDKAHYFDKVKTFGHLKNWRD